MILWRPLVFLVAAVLEVGGDALVRKGLTGSGGWLIALGIAVLGGYGVMVNLVPLDFSKLLGAYVAVFAAVSFAYGYFFFGERISGSMWLGLALVVAGSVVIQLGHSAPISK